MIGGLTWNTIDDADFDPLKVTIPPRSSFRRHRPGRFVSNIKKLSAKYPHISKRRFPEYVAPRGHSGGYDWILKNAWWLFDFHACSVKDVKKRTERRDRQYMEWRKKVGGWR